MSERLTAMLESLDAAGRGVRVEFCWVGDRYEHTILGVRGNSAALLLISGQNELLAPSLVEMQQQAGALLLTGANSVGHWSLSAEPQRHPSESIVLDLACRAKKQPAHVAVAYQVCKEARVRQLGDQEFQIATADCSIVISNLEAATLMQSIMPDSFTISIDKRPDAAPRHTYRWRYVIRLT